jgi:hypothetical protein
MAAAKMAAAEDSGGGRQQRWLAASMRAAATGDGVDGSRRGGRGRGPGGAMRCGVWRGMMEFVFCLA